MLQPSAAATSLSERWGFVLRLQMLMNISPSTLAWSLMLITELLLFLVAFAGSGSFLCACVKRAAKAARAAAAFALLCVPLALIGADIAEKALMGRPAAALSHRRAAGGDDIDL